MKQTILRTMKLKKRVRIVVLIALRNEILLPAIAVTAGMSFDMKVYAVEICTFSCDIMGESYIKAYFSTERKAEDFILREGLLDKGFAFVDVVPIEIDEE